MRDINKVLPNIKHFCYATAHNSDSFCDFMKTIKSDMGKFDALAEILSDKVFLLKKDIDLLVPVPKFKDEFNETDWSLKLVEFISKRINIPCNKDLIKKIRKTKKLKTVPVSQREKEIKNAFEIKDFEELKDKKICIIDDVFSSGNTIKEIIKTLSSNYDIKNISIAVLVFQEN